MRKLTLLVTALLFAASAASGVSIKSNRCGVDVYARPDFGTWFYTVTLTLKRSCPPGSFAQVRLEHGTSFELRTEYTALPADPQYPNRTWATGVVATFLRRFAGGDIPVFY